MRSIVWKLLVWGTLVASPFLVPILAQSRWDGSDAIDRRQWRRTTLGWEPASRWQAELENAAPLPATTAIHPLVIAGLQVLGSFAALLAFAKRPDEATRTIL